MKRKFSRRDFVSTVLGSAAVLTNTELLPTEVGIHAAPVQPVFAVAQSSTFSAPKDSMSQWNYFSSKLIGPDLLFEGLDFRLAEVISTLSNLTVYADIVRIQGLVKTPGRSIYLHARQIICESDAIIDVSGKDGDSFIGPAKSGQVAGEEGKDGSIGRPGGSSGNITIIAALVLGKLTIRANGGRGGAGQDAGDGQIGGVGPDGKNGEPAYGKNAGAVGGQGRDGGPGGAGGEGGVGGTAGVIALHLIDHSNLELKIEASGGVGGNEGRSGMGGGPGPGGPGGKNYKKQGGGGGGGRGNGPMESYWVEDGRAPNGPLGNTGPVRPPKGPGTTQPPKSTSLNEVVIGADTDFLGATSSISETLMALHRAEIDYVSANLTPTVSALTWIELITRSNPGSKIPPPGKFGSPLSGIPSTAEWVSIRNKALILLTQMQSGLDFYGFPQNWAPGVTIENYKQYLGLSLPLAKDIAIAADRYWQNEKDAETQKAALASALSLSRTQVDSLQAEMKQIGDRIEQVQAQIDTLTVALNTKQLGLVSTSDAFKDAVIAQTGGCNIAQSLSVLSSLLTFGATAYTSIASIVKSVGALDSMAGEIKTLAQKKTFISTLKEIGGSVTDIRDGYKSIAPLLSKKADSAKLMMDSADFEKVVQPYLDMPEAQAYRSLMRDYIDTVQVRNDKILEITSLETKQFSLEADVDKLNREIDRLLAIRAENHDPVLPEMQIFMSKLLNQTKFDLIRALYQLRKALEYWSLTDVPLNIEDQDLAQIQGTYNRLLTEELQAREARNNPVQKFGPIKLLLNRKRLGSLFDTFCKTGFLTFTIPPDESALQNGYAAITVNSVDIKLPKAKTTSGNINVRLVHSGRGVFVTPNHRSLVFNHLPRIIAVSYHLQNWNPLTELSNNLSGDGSADLSPFTTWTLEVRPEFNPGLSLASVEEVSLTFYGHFLPFI